MTVIPILCYHKVGLEREEGRRLNIEPSRLAAHVRFFQRHGRPILRAVDLVHEWPPSAVVLTFDDAYRSTMTRGVETLDRLGVKSTFYAVGERVGRTSEWDGPLARPLADWSLLRSARDSGHEIGNHTATHAALKELSPEEQREEIVRGGARLRSEGLAPRTFAFPYGGYGEETLKQLKGEPSAELAFSLGKRFATPQDPRLALPRIPIAFSDALPLLVYRLWRAQRRSIG